MAPNFPVSQAYNSLQTSGRQLPPQLLHPGRPLPSHQCRFRSLKALTVVCGVAIPMPTGFTVDSPPQSRRPASGAGSSTSALAEKLQRTLSGKTAGSTDGVTEVHSPQELQDQLRMNDGKLIVLMCKATSCRPCKMFTRKYQRIAAEHSIKGAVFLEIMGDETLDTRKLMMAMQIKVTPTFCFYRGSDVIRTVTGINEDNLRNAVKEELQQGASQQQLPAHK